MAKDGPLIEVLLRSTADTGCTFATTENRRTTPAKLERPPCDPGVRLHVAFREIKA